MLCEQRKQCSKLHAQELAQLGRNDSGAGRPGSAGGAPPRESDAQGSMFEVIARAAVQLGKPAEGVWASHLQPYVCCGAPVMVSGAASP